MYVIVTNNEPKILIVLNNIIDRRSVTGRAKAAVINTQISKFGKRGYLL